MPACPICHGHGHHDHRDSDAWFAEHHTDAELAAWERRGFVRTVGIVDCDECEATGVVSEQRARLLHAAAVAHVEQIIARLDREPRPHLPD